MSINNLGFSCLHLCGPLLVRGPKFEKKRLRKLAYLGLCIFWSWSQQITSLSTRNGKFYETERQSKILEHSEDKLYFSSYNQSRRNGTMMPMHLTNRNGVPVHFEPWLQCPLVLVEHVPTFYCVNEICPPVSLFLVHTTTTPANAQLRLLKCLRSSRCCC